MRVALVSEFFYPTLGGVQDHLFQFSKEMIRRGHEVSIVTPHVFGSGEFHNWWPKELPRTVYQPVGYSLPFFANGSLARMTAGFGVKRKLEKLLSPNNFDLVHLHSPLAGAMPILALMAASVPVVGTFHTYFDKNATLSVFNHWAQKQVDALDGVVAVSPVAERCVQKYLDIECDIVPNGVDTQWFKPHWELTAEGKKDDRLPEFRDGKINIFFIGRPDPRNGLDTLIRAFAKLHRLHKNTRLIVAGDGELMSHYRTLNDEICEAGSVVFLGSVRDERPQLYRSSDIHVFGVERASFGITLLEGMASGLPVVTTTWDGLDFIGTPGVDLMATPFGDVDALVATLDELVKNPAKRKSLGETARKNVQRFSWVSVTDQILEFYARVL